MSVISLQGLSIYSVPDLYTCKVFVSICWCLLQLRHCTQTVSVPITLGWPIVLTHTQSMWHRCRKYSVLGTSLEFEVLRLLQPHPSWPPLPHQWHCFLGAATAGENQGPCPHLLSGHPFSSALPCASQDGWNSQVSSSIVMLSLQRNEEENIQSKIFLWRIADMTLNALERQICWVSWCLL